ncbi:HpcH/HpaI aldolase family protein [Deinococcus apachensis]|uniref:HpcH/HpaI aldolase family protein n=1 Tax=Deinococcus apachensis TaxID=309886 RepID=UPI000380463F|nr:aldolase/citrate lyase family protein [Deinococcus apachensis]
MPEGLSRLAERFAAGETVLGGWLHLPGGVSAEVMGHAGYDALTVDLQHGLIGEGGLVATLEAIAATPAVPLVRVPWLHPPDLMRALDAGAAGVICPMIDTPGQARALVQACRYPPRGGRSFGPTRARLVYGDDYGVRADLDTLVFAMIETGEALGNLEAILDTPGLSGVFVGPGDLSLSLTGRATLDFRGGEPAGAVARIAQETLRRGLIPGIFTPGAELARAAMDLGYRFVTPGSDLALLAGAARAVLGELRGQQPTPAPPTSY